MNHTSIEWTDATWNPTTGCTKISPGCTYCYSERLSLRLRKMGVQKYENEFRFTLHPSQLDLPLRWRKPRKIFVNSMSDLFHEEMPDNFLQSIFSVIKRANWHIYQILTKRPERMLDFVDRHREAIPEHVWMGVTVEAEECKSRIDLLREVPARIRFISFEPLLNPVGTIDLRGVLWVIAGGESGPNRRIMKPEWVREIRDQCVQQCVPFFFKQWGGFRPRSGGRLLDGKTWDEYPSIGVDHLKIQPLEGSLDVSCLPNGKDVFVQRC